MCIVNPMTHRLDALTLAIALCIATTGAVAQNNLLTTYQAAQQYDASFAGSKASVLSSKEKTLQAKAGLRPTLNLTSGASLGHQEVFGNSKADRTSLNGNVALAGSYPLWRPAVGVAISQAELGERLAQASFANAQQDLITRVAQAYFDVLLAQDTLASIAAQKAAISEQLAQAKREFEVGTKTILDTNEAQARFDLMLAQEAIAKGDELSKRAALSLMTGTDPSSFAGLKSGALVSSAQPSDINAWALRAEQASIPVQIAQLNSDIAQLEITRNQKNLGYSLDLTTSVSANRANPINVGIGRSTSTSANVGVSFSYPILNGGSLQSKVREAMINHDKSLADLDAAKRNAAQNARQSYLSLTYGINQIKALESAQRSNQTLLESTKLGYQVGVRINLDVLNAQQALESNKKDLAKARYDALMAGLRLKASTAQLSELDIQTINGQLQ